MLMTEQRILSFLAAAMVENTSLGSQVVIVLCTIRISRVAYEGASLKLLHASARAICNEASPLGFRAASA